MREGGSAAGHHPECTCSRSPRPSREKDHRVPGCPRRDVQACSAPPSVGTHVSKAAR